MGISSEVWRSLRQFHREQRRRVESDLFRICLDYVLLSGNHVASLINSFAECGVHRLIFRWPTSRLEGKRQGHHGASK